MDLGIDIFFRYTDDGQYQDAAKRHVRGAEVQWCRGAEVQRYSVQRYRGTEVQRCRGAGADMEALRSRGAEEKRRGGEEKQR
mgnify:CR=1 FL=1